MVEKEVVEEMIREAMNGRYQGKYEKALEKYGMILDSLIDIEDPRKKWISEKTGEVMHQIGVTYQNMGKFTVALLQLKQAKYFRRYNNDIIGYAFTCFQIAMCRLARGSSALRTFLTQ